MLCTESSQKLCNTIKSMLVFWLFGFCHAALMFWFNRNFIKSRLLINCKLPTQQQTAHIFCLQELNWTQIFPLPDGQLWFAFPLSFSSSTVLIAVYTHACVFSHHASHANTGQRTAITFNRSYMTVLQALTLCKFLELDLQYYYLVRGAKI